MSDHEKLIWEHNPGALREQPVTDPTTWAGAVQHDLIKFGINVQLTTPSAGKAFYFAAVVMMLKDEADIIGENLIWLHHTGVRRFVILDNESTDSSLDIVKRFRREYSDVELLILNDPLVRYMQSEKTTGLFRLATSIWPDIRWVIPVDADEFLVAEHGLAVFDSIAEQTDAISIPKVIHFKTTGTQHNTDNNMGKMSYRSPMFSVPPKIIARSNQFTTITQGNHQIRLVDNRPASYVGGLQYGLYYREFPTRSFEHFLRKVRNGGRAIKAAEEFLGRNVGGEHWVNYYNSLMSGGEEHLLTIYTRDWVRGPSENFVVDPFVVDASKIR